MANTYLLLMFFFPSFISLCKAQLCSRDDKIINCIPCSTIKQTEKFNCPQQCTKKDKNFCSEVCNKFCVKNQCKFENGSLKCTEGCVLGLTGKTCNEVCTGNCKKCEQLTGKCLCEGDSCSKNEQRTTKQKDEHVAKITFTTSNTMSQEGKTNGRKTVTYLTRVITPENPRTSPGVAFEGKSYKSGLRYLLAGIVLTVIVASAITTISLILVWREKRKRRRLNV